VFFSNHSLPAGIADAIFSLSHLSAKVFIHIFCSAPFPKDDFTALLPHCSLPARIAKNIPHFPYIYAEKISGVFFLFISPVFLPKEKTNE
jgi:hypothetical protein